MKRLITETDDVFERTLLESARRDGPPRFGGRDPAQALAAAAANLASLGSAASSIVPPALGAERAIVKGTARGLWRWLGVGIAVGGVAGAGAMASFTRAPAAAIVAAPTAGTTSVVAEPTSSAQPELAPQPSLEAPPSAPRARTPPVSVSSAAGAPDTSPPPSATVTDSPSTLAAEANAVDRARRALAAGSPTTAIELLDRYELESPTHALAPDAQALRIQAEEARGNTAVAKKMAERFLASHPNDPHADRVRRVLSGARAP